MQAMVSLCRMRGQVDFVLADPPYNTGNDSAITIVGRRTRTSRTRPIHLLERPGTAYEADAVHEAAQLLACSRRIGPDPLAQNVKRERFFSLRHAEEDLKRLDGTLPQWLRSSDLLCADVPSKDGERSQERRSSARTARSASLAGCRPFSISRKSMPRRMFRTSPEDPSVGESRYSGDLSMEPSRNKRMSKACDGAFPKRDRNLGVYAYIVGGRVHDKHTDRSDNAAKSTGQQHLRAIDGLVRQLQSRLQCQTYKHYRPAAPN